MSGKKALSQVQDKAVDVIAVLAQHGHEKTEGADEAFAAGLKALDSSHSATMPKIDDWCKALDEALPDIDRLKPADKEILVKALIATVMADDRIAVSEVELLRVICALIHVPLPMITGGEPVLDQD